MTPLERVRGETERSRKWHEAQRPNAKTPMVAVRLSDLALLIALADAVIDAEPFAFSGLPPEERVEPLRVAEALTTEEQP